jgi:hypothetical protein
MTQRKILDFTTLRRVSVTSKTNNGLLLVGLRVFVVTTITTTQTTQATTHQLIIQQQKKTRQSQTFRSVGKVQSTGTLQLLSRVVTITEN